MNNNQDGHDSKEARQSGDKRKSFNKDNNNKKKFKLIKFEQRRFILSFFKFNFSQELNFELIEILLYKVQNGEIIDKLHIHLKNEFPISKAIIWMKKPKEDVEKISKEEAWLKINGFVEKCTILEFNGYTDFHVINQFFVNHFYNNFDVEIINLDITFKNFATQNKSFRKFFAEKVSAKDELENAVRNMDAKFAFYKEVLLPIAQSNPLVPFIGKLGYRENPRTIRVVFDRCLNIAFSHKRITREERQEILGKNAYRFAEELATLYKIVSDEQRVKLRELILEVIPIEPSLLDYILATVPRKEGQDPKTVAFVNRETAIQAVNIFATIISNLSIINELSYIHDKLIDTWISFMDMEFNSGYPMKDFARAIEVSSITYTDLDTKEVNEYHSYINPEEDIKHEIINIFKKDKTLYENAKTFKEQFSDINEQLENRLFIGFSIQADINVMLKEYEKIDETLTFFGGLDLVLILNSFIGKPTGLEKALKHFEIPYEKEDLHSALVDARFSKVIFEKIVEMFKAKYGREPFLKDFLYAFVPPMKKGGKVIDAAFKNTKLYKYYHELSEVLNQNRESKAEPKTEAKPKVAKPKVEVAEAN